MLSTNCNLINVRNSRTLNLAIKSLLPKVIFVCFVFAFLFFSGIKLYALTLPKDTNGWTVFTPSSDTRIVYVSNTGNDGTGEVYGDGDFADPFDPGSVNAFATYSAAFAKTRDGYPDWILYKRGDTFSEPPGSNVISGRDSDEPFLIGSYGASGASPLIETGTSSGVAIVQESPSSPGTTQYVAIQGLNFYANERNPDDGDFVGYDSVLAPTGISVTTYGTGNVVKHILIEGCSVSYYRNNMKVQASSGVLSMEDVVIRRNVILHSYSVSSHSQGIFGSTLDGLVIEENILDHNGWLIQAESNDKTEGGATIHNHNIYTDGVQNLKIRQNIFMRASSIGTKLQNEMVGLEVNDNLYIDGELGIESCNNYSSNYYRVHNPVVINNVFYKLGLSNPTLRNVAWGMWIQGWDGGQINNNILIGQQGQMFFNLGLRSRGMEIFNNIGMLTTMTGITHNSDAELLDVEIHDNYFEKTNSKNERMFTSKGASIDGITFSNNEYYSPITLEFRVGDTYYNPTEWQAAKESTAEFAQRSFTDSSRTIETYMLSLGQTGTLDSFIAECRSQDRYSWDVRFMANNVNSWIRDGYGMAYDSGGLDEPNTSPVPSAPSTLRIED